jgi:hypothetical protein
VLRDANLIYERREGARRLYRAARDQLGALEALLADFWRDDLTQLGKTIEQDKKKGRAR